MILLHALNLFYLCINGIVVGGSIHVANNAEGDGETIVIAHQSELQLQSVVLAVSVVNKYVVDGIAILANLYDLQAEALLNQSELIVLAEHQLLTMLNVDSVLLTTFIIIYHIVAVIVEDDTVLQHLGY